MTRRQKAIAIVITFCVLLVAAAISLNVSWILITARRDALLILGVILFALIIAGIIVIGAIGLAADQAVRRVRAHVCRWQEGLTASPE